MFLNFIIFIFFFIFLIFSAILVISSRNPIHSILFLILVFVNASGLLLLLNLEFLAMMFLIVYVGAIAVLFLFVVMMLNIKIIELNENLIRYLPIGIFISLIFFFEIFFILDNNLFFNFMFFNFIDWVNLINSVTNMELIGQIIYTYYSPLFLLLSLLLLIAMIGPILLTLQESKTVKKQLIYEQVLQDYKTTVFLKK